MSPFKNRRRRTKAARRAAQGRATRCVRQRFILTCHTCFTFRASKRDTCRSADRRHRRESRDSLAAVDLKSSRRSERHSRESSRFERIRAPLPSSFDSPTIGLPLRSLANGLGSRANLTGKLQGMGGRGGGGDEARKSSDGREPSKVEQQRRVFPFVSRTGERASRRRTNERATIDRRPNRFDTPTPVPISWPRTSYTRAA